MKLSREFTKVLAWVLWTFGVLFLLRAAFVMAAGMDRTWPFGVALIALGFYVNARVNKAKNTTEKKAGEE